MSLSRQDRLHALGLWPAWRLRVAAPVETPRLDVEAPSPAEAICETPPPMQGNADQTPADSRLHAKPIEDASIAQPAPPGLSASPVSEMDWTALNAAIKSCTRCDLAKSRTQAVAGVGDARAEWLFVGEAPGANEDRLGEPFVGDAGKLLDAILAAIGLARGKNVYIANVLKSRPPGNRDPRPEEVAACLPFLERQIELIQPKLIVALGRFAAQSLLATDTPIGRMRGQLHRYRGVPLVVTYHPAYLLRNPMDKAKVWEDLVLARDTMQDLKSERQPSPRSTPCANC